MQNIGMRFLLSVLFVLGGINFIAFAMEGNGSADPRNPSWRFFGGFLDFEATLIKGIFYLAGAGIVAALVVVIAMSVFSGSKTEPVKAAPLEEKDDSFNEHLRKQEAHQAQSRAQEIAKSADLTPQSPSNTVNPKPLPKPVPRLITIDELKKKAIKQIMGGR